MKRLASLAVLVLALGIAGSRPAEAGASFDFLFNASSVHDDNQLFLNLTVSNYGIPRPVLEPMLPRIRSVETDLPVILFLSKQSGRPVDVIVGLRSRGLSWPAIFPRVGVRYDVLFAGIDRDPGPPYGKAWGYWKKHGRNTKLTETDIVGLAQVQVGHHVCGVPSYELARVRTRGRTVVAYVADKKGRSYRGRPPGHGGGPKEHGAGPAGGPDDGKGKGHGPGKGHGRGHDKDHDQDKDKGH